MYQAMAGLHGFYRYHPKLAALLLAAISLALVLAPEVAQARGIRPG
jgi:hypothetical protein